MARRINLVPQSERARTNTNFAMLGIVAACIVVLFGLGLAYYMFSHSLNDKKLQVNDLTVQVQALQAQVDSLAKYDALDNKRKGVEQIVSAAYTGRTPVSEMLDKLSLVVPDNVWFASMQLQTADPNAKPAAGAATAPSGTFAITGDTYSFEDVAQFLVRLQLIPALANVNLQSAGTPSGNVDPSKGIKGFSIQATLNNTQAKDTPLPVSKVEVQGL